jgi:succinate dehydrogenase/fumarate reductase-like Fe-S protein
MKITLKIKRINPETDNKPYFKEYLLEVEPRKEVLDDDNGVNSCDNHYNWTKVCPRGIKIKKNINTVKRKRKKNKETEN